MLTSILGTQSMKIKVVNKSKHKVPSYSLHFQQGMDIRANINEDIVLKPMEELL